MDVSKIGVYDPRLVQGPAAYAVHKGATSISAQPFQALAQNSSNHVYSVIVPSLNTCVGRTMQWQSTFYLKFTATYGAQPAANIPIVRSGSEFALASFPLHRLTSSLSCTINDVSVTCNTALILPTLLRLADSKKGRNIMTTPCENDLFAQTTSGSGAISNPYGSVANYTNDRMPNGAYPFVFCDPNGNVITGNGVYANAAGGGNINYVNGVPQTSPGVVAYSIYVRYTVTEPLMLSPFQYGEGASELETSLNGLTSMQLTAQMQNPSVARILRQLSTGVTISGVDYLTVGTSPFANSQLLAFFQTPPISLALPEKNIVPFSEWQAYPFASGAQLAAGTTGTVRSNVVSLSQVPDMLLIRVTPNTYGATDGDWCLPISNVNITFDNASGLLSSIPASSLYRMSRENGLYMEYLQWAGLANGSSGFTQMSSGELVLAFGKDIQLFAGNAPGVSGNFSLSVQCDVTNTSANAITPTITLLTVCSGFFVSQHGRSSRTTMPLVEADVLGASDITKSITIQDLKRMVGRGWASSLANAFSKARSLYQEYKPVISSVKNALKSTDHEGAKKVAHALETVGFGARTGSGMSGYGSSTGSGKHKNIETRFQ